MLPVDEIREFVKKETTNINVFTHDFGHLRRVADGAVWFVRVLGGSEHEQQLACIAGLLHDIVRPADENIDHAVTSAERSKQILEEFSIDAKDKENIIAAIRDHSLPVRWKSPLHQSAYLADKIFEQMGDYIIFRRCMFVAESVTYNGMPMEKVINEHFAMRIKRIPKNAFPAKFSNLVDYQYGWMIDAQKALQAGEIWMWNIAKASYEAGKTHDKSLEELILTFEPSSPEAAKVKKEAVDYLEGKLLSRFEKMI